jgi:hypothetical protein
MVAQTPWQGLRAWGDPTSGPYRGCPPKGTADQRVGLTGEFDSLTLSMAVHGLVSSAYSSQQTKFGKSSISSKIGSGTNFINISN